MNGCNRREALKALGAASAALLLPGDSAAAPPTRQVAAAPDAEIQVVPVSPHTIRLSVLPMQEGRAAAIPRDESLFRASWGAPAPTLRAGSPAGTARYGDLRIVVSPDPLTFTITSGKGETIQRLRVEPASGTISDRRLPPARTWRRGAAV